MVDQRDPVEGVVYAPGREEMTTSESRLFGNSMRDRGSDWSLQEFNVGSFQTVAVSQIEERML